MKHPHSSKVYEIAMTLDFVATAVCNEVDMGNGASLENSCGTPCCHGSWLEYAAFNTWNARNSWRDFIEGANLAAKHLGFISRTGLQFWANDNPKIWGNNHGYSVFDSSGARAFAKTDETLTLKDIANHWYAVAGRLEEMESKK